MAVLAKKPRYTVVGDFSVKDEHGLVHHLVGGDVLPPELQELLSQDEIDIHVRSGMFRPVGWTPPPPQGDAPAKSRTPQEIIGSLGLPTGGPRGVELRQLGKPPSPKDLEGATAGGPTVVIVHQLPDGRPVATLDFARLMALYASMPGAR